MEPLEIVFHYHERTKHHPNRYARSLGYLDWATQPDPFRRFEGAPFVPLPALTEDDTPPYADLYVTGAIPPRPITAGTISRFLECSLAISAWKEYRGTRWALRSNPSSGNLHPTEGYLILGSVDGIATTPGVYHYASKEHGLERRAEIAPQAWDRLMGGAAGKGFLVGLSSVLWREAWKYGERAFRYCQHDVGHALAALRLATAMLGWRLISLPDVSDEAIARLLGLDRAADFAGAEPEEPELIALVCPSGGVLDPLKRLDPEATASVAAGSWFGKANALSRDHVEWEVIDLVADASRFAGSGEAYLASGKSPVRSGPHPGGVGHPRAFPMSRAETGAGQPTAHQIIRRRRSAVAFDGTTSIDSDMFFHILSRVVASAPLRPVPFDAFDWTPRIHLLMFVHRVTGLFPGLYALVRDPDSRARLKDAMSREFAWTKPAGCPEWVPLYLLQPADCRKAAAQLSLGQDIAGDGVFSLGMVADFERSLREFGPWFYRRFYWEAGVIGQVLYLEAEAAGIRATGIGAYFDDWVHEVFGLAGREFQIMYHFSMGGPVEDTRLTTLPAYPWSRD